MTWTLNAAHNRLESAPWWICQGSVVTLYYAPDGHAGIQVWVRPSVEEAKALADDMAALLAVMPQAAHRRIGVTSGAPVQER